MSISAATRTKPILRLSGTSRIDKLELLARRVTSHAPVAGCRALDIHQGSALDDIHVRSSYPARTEASRA